MPCTPWNSLEIVKVIVSLIAPIIGGIIAWRLAKIAKDLERKQWTSQKVIEKRLEFYEKVVPELNDLYCYYHRYGNWKELTPVRLSQKSASWTRNSIYTPIFSKPTYGPVISHLYIIVSKRSPAMEKMQKSR